LTKIFKGAIIEISEKMRTLKKYLIALTLAAMLTIGGVTAMELVTVYRHSYTIKVIEPIQVKLIKAPKNTEVFPETTLEWIYEVKNLDTKPWNLTYTIEPTPSLGLNAYFTILIDPDGPGPESFQWIGKREISTTIDGGKVQYAKIYVFTQTDAFGEFSFDFIITRTSAAKG
jgi:hypothetical protein